MSNDYAASVQGVMMRVTALDALGTPLSDPSGTLKTSYITNAFMKASFTVEFEDGQEILEKNAAGEICVTYKAADTLKRITMEIDVCDPDPELTKLLAGGDTLLRGGTGLGATDVVGYASPQVGQDATPNGVAIEVWSLAVTNGGKASVDPYWHWLFPHVKVRASGDRVIENGQLANVFTGQGIGNANFVNNAPGPAGKTVSNKALTSNVATLTTSAAHGFNVGDTVNISGVDSTFNGTFTILSTPTTTTFTYAKTAADVVSASATGTALVTNAWLWTSDRPYQYARRSSYPTLAGGGKRGFYTFGS
jgi:hypothetical protein